MKKLNKLFAILIAVLGVGSLSAQTDVTSQYLTNAGFDDNSSWITVNVAQATTKAAKGWTATSSGDTWWYGGAVNYGSSYTVNTVTPPAKNPEGKAEGGALGISAGWGCTVTYKQEVTLPAGVYTLSYKAYNANTGATQANNYIGFTSSAVTAYGKTTNFTANTWVEESVTFVLSSQTTGNISVGMGAISGGSGSNAKLFVDGVKLSYKPFTDVTEANPVDLTSMISNTKAAWAGATETPGYDGITMVAVYKGSDWTGDALSQTINGLPAGNYKMEVYCQAHSSWDTDVAKEGATGYTYLCANEYKLDVPIRNADGAGTKLLHTFEKISITNGTLKISVVNEQKAANWISIYVKSLTFLGPDKSLEEANFNNNVTALKALSTENLPAAFVDKINSLKSTYGSANASTMTLSELVAANGEIQGVIGARPTIAESYANLKDLISTCNSLKTISAEQTSGAAATFATAITTATTAADAATTVTELNNAYNTLETARRTYMQNAYPTSGNTLDFSYLIENGDWEDNSGSYNAGGVAHEEKYSDNPWVGNVMWDNISGLANGMYNVEIYLSASAAQWKHTSTITDGDQNTSITVNDVKTLVGVYKRTGVGSAEVVTLENVMVKDGTMNFTITNDKEGANWVIVAHKSITMTGKIDNTALQNRITTLKAEANGIKGSDMNSTIKGDLNAAINNADATSEDPDELNQMIESLEAAIAAANPSIADYAKLKRYIAMTKVFTDVAAYETKYDNGEYTSEDVDPIRKELNIARYNAASVVFPNEYEVTGWTGDLANVMRSDQHWSGQTIQYYDANSWTANFVGLKHTLSTTVTLPEGTYVLKAAGRSSEDATLRLNIKNGETVLESVEYTGKGDTGYGIDTEGNANFSAEGTYADVKDENGNVTQANGGRGWEWEFAKFELNAEATVTLHVEVDYNSIQNRFGSFSDITLWMDDKTYVTVYGKELDAPLAEAKALVNTLPMGANENTALANAITMGEGELSGPAELNAAVEGLKDAVAAANTWRETYYSKKPALVAALERFEADYNDAENGALGHLYMCKNLWSTAINMAQAAAVAKDVRNSYDGFETAAKNLNDALDAVTRSDGEYEALDAAIKAAKPLYEGNNFGNNAFQIPASAKENLNTTNAQAVYNAATADGDDVTSITEALNSGINTTLNAPTDDQRFYIKVATDGHDKKDNAWLVTLGGTGANNPTGYGINANNAVKAHLNQAFIFTQVEGNLYSISIERAEGTVYLTYGALNGSAAGWKNQQIQATTNEEDKGQFKIVPTGKNGVLKIFNTIDNNYLDCQDGGSIYTDTGIEKDEFAFELAAQTEVTLTLSSIGWATLILPFNAALPEGVKAYSCGEADGETLTLVEAESIKANTPYLMNGYQSTHNFSGYGLADKDSYTEGLFIGTYVEYKTTANSNTYVLQYHDGEVAFYLVGSGENAQPTVGAYRCYMTYENAAGAPKFSFRGGNTTEIDNMESTANNQQPIVIYDLMGRKVTTMEKGKVYIVNGKKVIVK